MAEATSLTLKQRIFAAGGWTIAGFGLSQAIRFGSSLLMTRLLVPEMFGVVAIATMVMVGLAMFSDLGIRQSIVQSRRGQDAAYLNTAWVIQILRGLLIWLLSLSASMLLIAANNLNWVPQSSVYAEPTLPYVLAVLSFSAVIMGFESTKLLEASRNISLKRVTQLEIISQVTGLLCMFAWIAYDRSIWALVAGSMCASLARSLLSHLWLQGNANYPCWDRTAVREIIGFGKWIFLSSILGFLVNNGDRLLLSSLVNSTILGIYTIAFLIASSVELVLTKLIGEISFPALSEVARERPSDLPATYYRFHAVISVFTYFCAGILIMAGSDLIELLYDDRYAQAGWMLEVLAVALLAIPFRVAAYCFMALGIPKLLTRIIAIRLITMIILVPSGFHLLGLSGALWGVVLSSFFTLPPTILYAVKHGLFNLKKEFLFLTALPVGMIAGYAISIVLLFIKNQL